MSHVIAPALTSEQWEAKDYRQSAREIDRWAKEHGGQDDDATEYVAKLGLGRDGSVIAMNRSHDRVLIPPPARAALAAFALAEQPFGFTRADLEALEGAAERLEGESAEALRNLAQRIRALLPR